MPFVPVTWAYQEVISSSKLNTMAANDDDLNARLAAVELPLAMAAPLTANTTPTSAEALAGLALTTPTVAGKIYEIRLTTRIQASVADLRSGCRIRRGTTLTDPIVGEVLVTPSFAGVGNTVEYTFYDTAPSGSTTWTVSVLTLGGAGNTNIAAAASYPSTLTARRVS